MHTHGPPRAEQARALRWAMLLAAVYMVAEIVGGIWTGSLALLADAGHMVSDVAALAFSLFAIWMAQRPAGAQRTYGYLRSEILAALLQGVALIGVCVWICIEAFERLQQPTEILALPMALIAFGGLVVNALALWMLNQGRHDNLNIRGAWLHVMADALGSCAAIAAGLTVWAFGWRYADPIASLIIAALVVRSSWSLIRESVDVLMEASPKHIDVEDLRSSLASNELVLAVHDLHVWTITSGVPALSCHLVISDLTESSLLLEKVNRLLHDRFGIEHTTIQIEPEDFREHSSCD